MLSDRDSDAELAPIPSLLLTAAVHHHLIREKTRTQVGLVVEAGDVREVHHVALLIGYGAAAVNPYLAMETVEDLVRAGHVLPGIDPSRRPQPDQGARQGRAQGDVQDGHLHRRLLPRRPDLRGRRPGQELVDAVLHRHHLPARRRRPRRHRRGGRRAGTPGPTRPAGIALGAPRARRSAASTSGAARASCTCSTRRRSSGCSTPPAPAATTSSRSTRRGSNEQSERLMTLRGLFELRDGERAAGADRRGRAGRARSSSGSRPARCRTAPSRRRPTRRSPSP